jgi:hypothetical protein
MPSLASEFRRAEPRITMAKRSVSFIHGTQCQTCPGSLQEEIRSPMCGRLASKENQISGYSVPEMGFINAILEKDSRRSVNLPCLEGADAEM